MFTAVGRTWCGFIVFWLQLKVIIYLWIQVLLLSNLYFCAEAIRPKGVIKCSKEGNEKKLKRGYQAHVYVIVDFQCRSQG